MRKNPKSPGEKIVKDIKRATRKRSRFESRVEPAEEDYPVLSGGLGGPAAFLTEAQARVYEQIRHQVPWLNESHRVSAEMAAILYQRMQDPNHLMIASEMAQLRALMNSFGATPESASRVAAALPRTSEGAADPEGDKPSGLEKFVM